MYYRCKTIEIFIVNYSHTLSVTLDYTLSSSRVRFNAATSSQTVTIPILEDDIVENDETITVTLSSGAIISTPRASVIVIDNDGK